MNSIESIQSTINNRYNQNIDFFKKSIPGIIKIIEGERTPLKLKLNPNNNQLFKESTIGIEYSNSPIEYAMHEVKGFYEKMINSHYAPTPSSLMVAYVIKKNPFRKSIRNYAESLNKRKNKNIHPYYKDLIIFGCGLGHHVEMLINKQDFNTYIIVEKNINNFKESLYTVNWGSILKQLPSKKYVSFIIKHNNESQEDFTRRVQYQVQEMFPSSVTSTLIYNHKTEEDYSEEKKGIVNIIDYGKVAYEKLAPDSHRLLNLNHNSQEKIPVINLNKTIFSDKDTPILIIGAGPSLDKYLEEIKQNKDYIYIVSCGSSLGSLLKNGIKPDFHFELEYQNLANDLIKFTNNKYSFDEITFIGSLEAHPKLFSYFNQSFAIIPETTELLENIEDDFILKRGGITCTNGAAALFSKISHSDIILVGLDFAHTNGTHHAKDNITNQHDLPEELKRLEEDGKTLLNRGTFKVKDVNGIDVNTTPSLNSARLLMETLAGEAENTFLNCSYGANIPNTKHTTPQELSKYLSNKKTNKPPITLKNSTLSSDDINSLTKHTYEISFNVSNQVLDIVKKGINNEPNDLCQKVINIYKSIKKETGEEKRGQFRSIMSINRLPTYLLFNIINFTEKDELENALNIWIEEYSEYINYVKKVIFKYIDSGNFYVTEDWNED